MGCRQLLLLLLLAITLVHGNRRVRWPKTGLYLCGEMMDPEYRQRCLACFRSAGRVIKKVRTCVRDWMPDPISGCHRERNLNLCVYTSIVRYRDYNRKAEVLYTKGGRLLQKVTNFKQLEDGPAALFSCMAQELFSIVNPLKTAEERNNSTCFERFQLDKANEHWHLSPSERPMKNHNKGSKITENIRQEERELTYEYGGDLGHDMPFHGIGPLAVDILKGECLIHYLENTGQLQDFVDAALANPYPVPAWTFQELLKKIDSFTLP